MNELDNYNEFKSLIADLIGVPAELLKKPPPIDIVGMSIELQIEIKQAYNRYLRIDEDYDITVDGAIFRSFGSFHMACWAYETEPFRMEDARIMKEMQESMLRESILIEKERERNELKLLEFKPNSK